VGRSLARGLLRRGDVHKVSRKRVLSSTKGGKGKNIFRRKEKKKGFKDREKKGGLDIHG